MPQFLIDKLKKEYPNNPHAVYGTLNKLGLMMGSRETPKGRQWQAKHDRDVAKSKDSVKLSRRSYVAEHKRLVKILKHPTRPGLRSEVREQSEDLREARKGA